MQLRKNNYDNALIEVQYWEWIGTENILLTSVDEISIIGKMQSIVVNELHVEVIAIDNIRKKTRLSTNEVTWCCAKVLFKLMKPNLHRDRIQIKSCND